MDALAGLTPMQRQYRKHPERVKARNKAWLKAHPEAQRRKWRNRYHNNPEKFRAKGRAHRLRNLEKRRAANLEWQRKNWAHRQAYMKRYQQENAQRLKAKKHQNYLENKATILAKTRAYTKAHPEVVRKSRRRFCKRHPAVILARAAQRRALKRYAALNHRALLAWMESVRSKKTATCYYCDRTVSIADVHFDHIVPISKGGQHTPENLCVSCATCNHSKGSKLISVWCKPGQQVLLL